MEVTQWARLSKVREPSSAVVGIWYRTSSAASTFAVTCEFGMKEKVIVRGYSLGVVGGVGEESLV
jgi:hypothetical protein